MSLDDVEEVLLSLKKRFDSQKKVLDAFYIDNCCAWRRKLKSVFGENLKVYLDVFHAVKRFTDKVPKRHPLSYSCISEWKMVFRANNDHGKERQCMTPTPEVLELNLDSFIKRWKDADYDGRKLLSPNALKELDNIRVHMKRGCLSGIQPGRGTNRNENLHKNINLIMSSSKYGVELAYGLLTVCFFDHNERMEAKSKNIPVRPIQHYMDHAFIYELTNEKFGLLFKDDSGTSFPCKDTIPNLREQVQTDLRSSYTQVYNTIMHIPLTVSYCGSKTRAFTHD